jgi:mRNA interferase RelE/StbE
MSYEVVYSKSALKEIKSLPNQYVKKVFEKSEMLGLDPRPVGCKKLVGNKEEAWRIRVGDYRILYTIEEQIKVVDIRKVGHRKDIYK